MDIVYVGTLPPHQGGSAIVAAQVLPGLAELGHGVRAIAPLGADRRGSDDSWALDALEVRRFEMPFDETSPDNPAGETYRERERTEVARLLAEAIDTRRPDAILIGRESFVGHVVDVARPRGVPTLLIVAGAATMGIVNGSYPRGQAESVLEAIRRVDSRVVSADHMREAMSALGACANHVIPNPVDLARFDGADGAAAAARSWLEVGEDEVLVSHVSNLKPIKRVGDLVAAAEEALRADDRLVFAIVGEGLCRDEAERDVAARGLGERFRFPGWVPYDRMPGVVAASDVVAMPSAGEAQALIYLETQAAARTLVASDIPAAREVVEDGRSGLLHPVGDVDALVATILRAAGDADLRVRLGEEARRRVRRHSLPEVVASYEEVIGSLVAQGSSRGG